MRAASWDCHQSVLRKNPSAGRTLDRTARSEPIRCGKEYIAFRCRLKAAVPAVQNYGRSALALLSRLRGGNRPSGSGVAFDIVVVPGEVALKSVLDVRRRLEFVVFARVHGQLA